MGYIIEISESKAEKLYEHASKMLRHGNRLMHCIEELCGENGYGEREGRDYKRDHDREPHRGESYDYGMRRGVPGTGIYSRYR